MSDPLATLHQDLRNLVGQTVAGRYRIDALIGVGGMAAVFRAHHEGLGRDLAVKVLHPNLSANSEMSARFEREARSASRLEHPNCVQVTDFGSTEDGIMYMVMQLLEGAELTGMLKEPLGAPRAVELVLQILRGLEHAHTNGVVHRDIKPENVFVTRDHEGDEVLKLVDFGIAKLTDATVDTHKTSAGLVFGTPAYMSPEQAMGVEADSRADLYSTGILFYQMLAGRLPIDNDDPVALVRMQVSVDPDPLPSSVPPVVAGVVARLLEKDRDRRFQTATEVIQTLESIELMLVDEHVSDIEITVPGEAESSTDVGMSSAKVGVAPPSGGVAANPRVWKWAGAAGAFALVLGAVAVLRSDDSPAEVTETRTAVSAESESAEAGDSSRTQGPPPAVLAEVDRLLLAKKSAEADALLAPLREQFPGDASLVWRQGKALALQRRKTAQALEVYGQALEADPDLLDNREFYAELHDLLRTSRIRKQAIAFSLAHHGEHGDKFLLETVNDEKNPLQYDARHEVLTALSQNPDNIPLINQRLNRALDILQAAASSKPCVSYSDALASIADEPEFYFYNRVDKATVPERPETPDPEGADDLASCDGLADRRVALLEELAALNPEGADSDGDDVEILDEGEPEPAPSPKKKRKPKKSKNDGCNRPGAALFNKKCRRR
jgi:tetratricopeptide (TPR) repeat protein